MSNIEREIARKIIVALQNAGILVTVDYDRGYEPQSRPDTIDGYLDQMFAVDEVWLMTGPLTNGSFDSHIYFIWGNGNDGYDCVTDYGMSLEPVLQPVLDEIERNAP